MKVLNELISPVNAIVEGDSGAVYVENCEVKTLTNTHFRRMIPINSFLGQFLQIYFVYRSLMRYKNTSAHITQVLNFPRTPPVEFCHNILLHRAKRNRKTLFFLAFLFKIFNQTPIWMLLFVYDYGPFFFILCCLACKIVLSCYIMASKWFSAIHGGLRLFRG